MMVSIVDLQQGDGSLIETPKGKVILVDGGDYQMFARYSGTFLEIPKKLMVFTHSRQKDLKEAYSFDIAADGTPTRKNVVNG